MDQTSTTKIPEWTEDTRIGRSHRSERHNVIRPSRRSVLFGGTALALSLAVIGSNLLSTVRPANANPKGYRIRRFRTDAGPCRSTGWVNLGGNQDRSCIGCGPSIIYSEACHTGGTWDGYHRGTLKAWELGARTWWKLRPDECGSGWDGWKWRTDSDCAPCPNRYWRCHDGYFGTRQGMNPSICRRCVSNGNAE